MTNKTTEIKSMPRRINCNTQDFPISSIALVSNIKKITGATQALRKVRCFMVARSCDQIGHGTGACA